MESLEGSGNIPLGSVCISDIICQSQWLHQGSAAVLGRVPYTFHRLTACSNSYLLPMCGSVSDHFYQGCWSGSESGSGSYRCFGNVKLYKQGKIFLKIEALHIFRWVFPFFQIKIIIILISKEICLIWKKFRCLNWFLVSASRIRIRFLKFWFAGSGSGRKWTGSATLASGTVFWFL